MKTYGNGGRVPPIFNFGIVWVGPTADVDALLGRKIS